jgi:hypothetical protein
VTWPRPARNDLSALLQRAIIVATALAMLLFALPLAVTISSLYRSSVLAELGQDGERTRAAMTEALLRNPAALAAALPVPHDPTVEIAIYTVAGQRVAGRGPDRAEPPVGQAGRTAVEVEDLMDGIAFAAVPLLDDNGAPRFVVRVAQPAQVHQTRRWRC